MYSSRGGILSPSGINASSPSLQDRQGNAVNVDDYFGAGDFGFPKTDSLASDFLRAAALFPYLVSFRWEKKRLAGNQPTNQSTNQPTRVGGATIGWVQMNSCK